MPLFRTFIRCGKIRDFPVFEEKAFIRTIQNWMVNMARTDLQNV